MGPFAGPGFGVWGGIVGLVVMVAFWSVIVWAVAALLRSGKSCVPGCGSYRMHRTYWGEQDREDPEQILARRYASGEIDEDEFHRRLDHLRSRDPQTEKDGIWHP